MEKIKSVEQFASFVASVKSDESKRKYPAGCIVVIEGERLSKNIGIAFNSAHKLLGTVNVTAASIGGTGVAGFVASGAAFLGGPLTILAMGGASAIGYYKIKARRAEHMCLPHAQEVLDLLDKGFNVSENSYYSLKLLRA